MGQEPSPLGVKHYNVALKFFTLAFPTGSQGQVARYLGLGFLLFNYVIPSNVLGYSGCIHKIGITTTHLPELYKIFSYFWGFCMWISNTKVCLLVVGKIKPQIMTSNNLLKK